MPAKEEIADRATTLVAAINLLGGQAATARLLQISQPTVWRWVHLAKPLPAEHVLTVEAATGVSRHDLRPDLYPREAPAAGAADLEPAR